MYMKFFEKKNYIWQAEKEQSQFSGYIPFNDDINIIISDIAGKWYESEIMKTRTTDKNKVEICL